MKLFHRSNTPTQESPDPHHITAENAYLYSPDARQSGESIGQRLKRFWNNRTRPQQVLLVSGTILILFSSLMIGLSLGHSSSTKTSQTTLAGSQQTSQGSGSSSDGSTAINSADDANGNGVPDNEEGVVEGGEGVAWWKKLFNVVRSSDDEETDESGTEEEASETNESSDESGMVDDDIGYIEDETYVEDGDTTSTDYDTTAEDVPASDVPQLATDSTASRFTIATWNVYTGNKQNVGDRTKTILGRAQILGLQEVNSNFVKKIKSITCSSCAYEAYLPSKADRFPIVWNKSYFTKVNAGYSYMVKPTGPYQKRYAVWVKLRNKATGKTLYAVNTHLPRGVEGNVEAKLVESYKKHMANLVTLLKSKQKDNIPIFITGDFNVNYRKDSCSTSWKPCDKLGALDIKSGWKITKLAGIGSKQGTHSTGSRLIDYVFVWKRSDTTVNSTYVLGGNKNGWGGSDHKPSFLNVTIK